jgi:phosphoglycolate phosphatase
VVSSRCADETASKPDPRMLREIVDEMRLAPGDALMIGDTDYDIEMARRLGMPALGVTCGVHDGGRLKAAGALALVESVGSVPAWLGVQGRE